MTHQQVTARWALIGNQPGGGINAGIQVTSDGDTDFGAYIGPFATGSPNFTIGSEEPEAPPWVTFGWVKLENGHTDLSIEVRDPSDQVDRTTRAVGPRRLFVCRYAKLKTANASYQTIWQALKNITLHTDIRAPVELTVESQGLENLLDIIEHYGFDEMARIAAVTLQARVAVTGAARLRRDERLAVMDAVAALLPYGLRAELSASSCVNNSVDHQIRLVFAEHSHDQQLLPLHGAGPGLPRCIALDYLEALHKKKRNSGLASLVRHLWNAKESYSFDAPEKVLEVLEQLNWVDDVIATLRDINLTRERLFAILRRPETEVEIIWYHSDISSEIRDRVIELLLDNRDNQATMALSKHWNMLGGNITGWALRRLDIDDTGPVQWLLRVAREVSHRAEDKFLTSLLTKERLDGGEKRRDALVTLLADRLAPPAGDMFCLTRDELRSAHIGTGHARLVLQLLIREISGDAGRGPSRAIRWALWLCLPSSVEGSERLEWADWTRVLTSALKGSGGLEWADWVLVLASVLSGTEVSPFSNVISLILRDHGWAVVLRLAWEARHLAIIVDEIWPGLVEIATHSASSQDLARRATVLADQLSFDSPDLGEKVVAVLDAARVLLGRTPGDFLVRTDDEAAFGRYDQRLEAVFGLQAVQGHGLMLERGFLDHVVQGDPLPVGAIWLMTNWAANTYRSRGLARYVVERDIASALLKYDQLDGTFWTALIEHEAGLKHFAYGPILRMVARQTMEQPAEELARAREGNTVPTAELARVICEAFTAGMPVEDIVKVLKQSTSADGKNLTPLRPEQLNDVLRQFQGLLFYDRSGSFESASVEALLEFYRLISGGALGQQFGRKFARRVKKDLKNQVRSRRRAIQALSRERFWNRLVRRRRAHRRGPGVPGRQVPPRRYGAGGRG